MSRQSSPRSPVLRSGTDARLGGEQALALYRIEGAVPSATPTVLIPPERRVNGVTFSVRRTTVPAADRATVRGIPTLRVERALLEVARTEREKRVRQAVDGARWLGLLRVERLIRRAEALRGHAGAQRILTMYAAGTFDPESEGERALQAFLGDLSVHFAWGVTGGRAWGAA